MELDIWCWHNPTKFKNRICCMRIYWNSTKQKKASTIMFYWLLSSDALDHTTSWIKSVLEELLSANIPTEQTQGKGQRALPGPFQILNTAFLCILTWDYDKGPLPEVRQCWICVCKRERVRFLKCFLWKIMWKINILSGNHEIPQTPVPQFRGNDNTQSGTWGSFLHVYL